VTDDRLAQPLARVEVLEHHAHEDVLVVGQALEIDARREGGRVQRGRPHDARRVVKLGRGRPFDDHARLAIRPAPDHRAARDHVADLDALRQLRRSDDTNGGAAWARARRGIETSAPVAARPAPAAAAACCRNFRRAFMSFRTSRLPP